MKELTLGSLFDGIGGFPLAASRYGIKTLWASEIEPFPIKVTKIRLPDMKHLGDITKINGAKIEPVDIITFGSPCQDLSVAGKRAGLAGERSGLFMEAVRIIKEMRSTYEGSNKPIQPRFAVWENVPGAFSSNFGEDFWAVLEETAKIADETITIPEPPKKWNKKANRWRYIWSTVGAIMGNGWSIAWRVLDAQYWGVPQRRRRIFLVADFGGQSAPEILFKRKGLSRHIAKGREAGQGIATDAERSVTTAGCNGKGWTEDVCYTLNTIDRPAVMAIEPGALSRGQGERVWDKCPTLRANMGDNQPCVVFNEETITSKTNASNPKPGDPCHTLGATGAGRTMDLVVGVDAYNHRTTGDKACSLTANSGSSATHSGPMVSQRYSVRRLTPLECERLQGFPDGWTDIPGQTEATQEELEFWREVWLTWDKTQAEDPEKVKPRTDKRLLRWLKNPVSDTAQYKALGNSLAVPCVEYVLEGISECEHGINAKGEHNE